MGVDKSLDNAGMDDATQPDAGSWLNDWAAEQMANDSGSGGGSDYGGSGSGSGYSGSGSDYGGSGSQGAYDQGSGFSAPPPPSVPLGSPVQPQPMHSPVTINITPPAWWDVGWQGLANTQNSWGSNLPTSVSSEPGGSSAQRQKGSASNATEGWGPDPAWDKANIPTKRETVKAIMDLYGVGAAAATGYDDEVTAYARKYGFPMTEKELEVTRQKYFGKNWQANTDWATPPITAKGNASSLPTTKSAPLGSSSNYRSGSRGGGGGGGGSSRSSSAPVTKPLPWTQPTAEPPVAPFNAANNNTLVFQEGDLGVLPDNARPYVDQMMRALGYTPTGVYGQYGAREYVRSGAGKSVTEFLSGITDPSLRAWLTWLAYRKGLDASPTPYPVTAPASDG